MSEASDDQDLTRKAAVQPKAAERLRGGSLVLGAEVPDGKENQTLSGKKLSGFVRAKGRSRTVVAFEDAMVSFFVEAAEMVGVPKSVAAIYGLCFSSPEPLSFSEINDRLEISSGSISQGLRVLREVGALKIAGVAATGMSAVAEGVEARRFARPRERYEPNLELRKLLLHWMEKRLQKQLGFGKRRLEAIINSIPEGSETSVRALHERLAALQTWHDKADALLPLAKTFLKLT